MLLYSLGEQMEALEELVKKLEVQLVFIHLKPDYHQKLLEYRQRFNRLLDPIDELQSDITLLVIELPVKEDHLKELNAAFDFLEDLT